VSREDSDGYCNTILATDFECAANVSSTSTASRKELSWLNQVDWKPKLRRCLLRWTCLRQHVCGEMQGYGKNDGRYNTWRSTASTPVSPMLLSGYILLSKEVWPHDTTVLWTALAQGSRASQVSVVCVCWLTAASLVLRLTLLRPFVRSLNRGARQHLRSAESSTLLVPSTRRSTLGDRSFSVAAARAWNALPQHVRNAPSLPVFRRYLKTVLFRSSFPDATWHCIVLYQLVRRSVLICHHVLAATNWF